MIYSPNWNPTWLQDLLPTPWYKKVLRPERPGKTSGDTLGAGSDGQAGTACTRLDEANAVAHVQHMPAACKQLQHARSMLSQVCSAFARYENLMQGEGGAAGSKHARAFEDMRHQIGLGTSSSASTRPGASSHPEWMLHGRASAASSSQPLLQQQPDYQVLAKLLQICILNPCQAYDVSLLLHLGFPACGVQVQADTGGILRMCIEKHFAPVLALQICIAPQ